MPEIMTITMCKFRFLPRTSHRERCTLRVTEGPGPSALHVHVAPKSLPSSGKNAEGIPRRDTCTRCDVNMYVFSQESRDHVVEPAATIRLSG